MVVYVTAWYQKRPWRETAYDRFWTCFKNDCHEQCLRQSEACCIKSPTTFHRRAELDECYLLVGRSRGHWRPVGTTLIYIPGNVLTNSVMFIFFGSTSEKPRVVGAQQLTLCDDCSAVRCRESRFCKVGLFYHQTVNNTHFEIWDNFTTWKILSTSYDCTPVFCSLIYTLSVFSVFCETGEESYTESALKVSHASVRLMIW